MAIAMPLRLMAPIRHRRAGAYYLRQPMPRFSSEPPPIGPGACWPTRQSARPLMSRLPYMATNLIAHLID